MGGSEPPGIQQPHLDRHDGLHKLLRSSRSQKLYVPSVVASTFAPATEAAKGSSRVFFQQSVGNVVAHCHPFLPPGTR